MRNGDYQIILMHDVENPFTVYQWNGKAFRYKTRMATETDVQEFVDANKLRYISSDTQGTWLTRLYRPKQVKQKHT